MVLFSWKIAFDIAISLKSILEPVSIAVVDGVITSSGIILDNSVMWKKVSDNFNNMPSVVVFSFFFVFAVSLKSWMFILLNINPINPAAVMLTYDVVIMRMFTRMFDSVLFLLILRNMEVNNLINEATVILTYDVANRPNFVRMLL